METISFTIPDRPAALRACAEMLLCMANLADPHVVGRDSGPHPVRAENPLRLRDPAFTPPAPIPPEPTTTPEKMFADSAAPAPVATGSTTTTTPEPPPIEQAAAATVASSAGTVTPALDSAGLPWDERIHSGGRSRIGDGTWKLKRGADPELVKQIRGANGVNAAMQADGPDLPQPPVDNGQIVADFINKTVTAIGAQFITTAQVTTALSAHGVEGGAVGLATHADGARIGAAVLAELGITDAPTV